MLGAMRFPVRVKPGASRDLVAGTHGTDGPLVVAVRARAVEGRANAAVVEAVAQAFGVRRSAVRLVRGTTGRDKLVEVDLPDQEAARRLTELRSAGP